MKKMVALLSILVLVTGCGAAQIKVAEEIKAEEEIKAAEKITAAEEGEGMKQYFFPAEDEKHEGTWINWPHEYTYGIEYRQELEPIWITMATALHKGENVHIVVYDEHEQSRVTKLLTAEGLDMGKIDFVVAKSDDVWSRDTGPMFVLDDQGVPVIADFAFDGWGKKTPYENDDVIPVAVAKTKNIPRIDLSGFVLEGGSVELDGYGTAMLCKSSVISENRNPDKTIAEAEAYLSRYFGATNFIWLEGVVGEDITDGHIDGMARFYDENTILTLPENDFFDLYEQIKESDYEALHAAKNANGDPYEIIEISLTAKNVENVDYKGCYLNYYVGNDVVLLPAYRDVNDAEAIRLISEIYSDKEIVPIDVTPLFQYGGMIHCVTQQQPENQIKVQ